MKAASLGRLAILVLVACGRGAALGAAAERPWTPHYKLRPDEKHRLTPADVVGPDGIEIIGNRLYGGNGKLVDGPGTPAVLRGNQALPLADAPRPQPAVPSIYEWQNRRR